jgi:hypothetical protein
VELDLVDEVDGLALVELDVVFVVDFGGGGGGVVPLPPIA